MAIGIGQMFGFHTLENFNHPYLSKTISEFWRRWHISLSTFFRDYLYIPLGGNRTGNVYINLLIVFFCTGLWHGASYNFIVWGLWHAFFILIERFIRNRKSKMSADPSSAANTSHIKASFLHFIQHVYAIFVVTVGWVFFRAPNLSYAVGLLKVMFGLQKPANVGFSTLYYLDHYSIIMIIAAIILSTNLIVKLGEKWAAAMPRAKQICSTACTVVLWIICGISVMTSAYNPFIYFKF